MGLYDDVMLHFFFFVCISHLLFISLTPWHSPDPFLLSSPYLALISFLLTPIILSPALVPVLCLFFGSFCLPPCLHCSDVLNLLRGLLKLSWWTTHRMKAQLHKRTTSKAKYVLFNSWKYVSTVKQIYFSRSVIDPKEQKTVAL